ncbi:extracellular matrix regulator RemB [Moorella sp. Hama-1]|uniref:extracellular matrix regulator RemB n=1 Tax=Moorella sp. Hama-1 TaxID=2138101 RepID=UPI000D64A912|nr:extracellular matrix/biofilm biosynthesis regulator RemA family protein [Moorella sp. Hama-1]BCV19936.1 DUF370 domain-containing protein [Moorella sp. Hama-1]
MYLHIGNDTVVPYQEIIAIIDLNTAGRAAATREFLEMLNEKAQRDSGTGEIKSCIVTDKEIYYSTISSGTLMKRATTFDFSD